MMQQKQDDAALQQDEVLAERIGTIVEKFYIFSNDLEIQIAEALAMSDTMGLHGTALTQDIGSTKRYLEDMKASVVVNLDCHLISIQRKMTPHRDVGTGEGSSRETSISNIHRSSEETFDRHQQVDSLSHPD